MFLVRTIGWLLSLPLVWMGQGAAMLGQPVCVPLLAAAWRLGGEGNIALAALTRCRQHVSLEAAWRRAVQWLAWRPQPEIAAFAALLAAQAGDLAEARRLVVYGQQLGRDRPGMLELVEFLLADADPDPEVGAETARRLAARDDLSPAVSKLVRGQLLWEAMLAGRMDEVRRRADHLWSIEDDALAATAFWLLDRRQGIAADLAARLDRFDLAPAVRWNLEILGHIAAGDLAEARQMLPRLYTLDAHAAVHAERYLQVKESSP